MIQAKADIKIINATWYMPSNPANAWEEHQSSRISDSTVFFDHDEICDKTSPLPHTMPSLQTFIDNM
jgi:thiosulfate/3-mercaptopyruvate sulfurtransferase